MASSNKTEKLGLNLWSESDRPQRNDFNSDNTLVDRAIGEHIADDSVHLTDGEKERLETPFGIYPYSGNGAEYQELTLPFDASAVFVYIASKPINVYDSTSGKTVVNGGFAFYGGDGTQGVRMTSPRTLRVYQGDASEGNVKLRLNESGVQYKLVVFR